MSIIEWLKNEVKKEEEKEVPIFLEDKINEYLSWYYKNMVKGKTSKEEAYSTLSTLQNFIDKMAIWYELRYPDYEVNKIIPYKEQEEKNVDEEMFENNPYINEELEENSLARAMNWDEFYNTSVFVRALPEEEKKFLKRPQYPKNISIEINGKKYYISASGIVLDERLSNKITLCDCDGRTFEFENLKIKELLELFKVELFDVSKKSIKEIEKAVEGYRKEEKSKEELLNAVMYRIIERGGPKLGARRAFLFAKEFGRDIDVPMMYGVDSTDAYQRTFINEYIKSGGSKNLDCYVNYGRDGKRRKLEIKTIEELLKSRELNTKESYTEEENAIHQRIVDILSKGIDKDKLEQEKLAKQKSEAKSLRLERNLNKSRNR